MDKSQINPDWFADRVQRAINPLLIQLANELELNLGDFDPLQTIYLLQMEGEIGEVIHKWYVQNQEKTNS